MRKLSNTRHVDVFEISNKWKILIITKSSQLWLNLWVIKSFSSLQLRMIEIWNKWTSKLFFFMRTLMKRFMWKYLTIIWTSNIQTWFVDSKKNLWFQAIVSNLIQYSRWLFKITRISFFECRSQRLFKRQSHYRHLCERFAHNWIQSKVHWLNQINS